MALLQRNIVPIRNSEPRLTVDRVGILPEGFDAERELAPGVFGFDLDTGRLQAHHLSPDSGGGLNDVAVAPTGVVPAAG